MAEETMLGTGDSDVPHGVGPQDRSTWPAWAIEPVSIVEPSEDWAGTAARLAVQLRPLLAPWLDGEVEHVGSTSVAGLAAKPIIDLMAPVSSLAAAVGADDPLDRIGWQLVPPELDMRPWRRSYVLPSGDRRLAHLHLVERSSQHWADAIAFRDALRADPTLAAAYADMKRSAAAEHPDDREAYTEAKTEFVLRVLDGLR